MPLFSVIIPLFNKEKYIKETLTSVLNQSFKDFELLVINDGSTDNSLEIANNILSATTNSRIITQKNSGLSATRNNGVKEAKGEIITFVDADDSWLPDFLQRIYNLYNNFPEASVYGTSYFEKFNDKTVLEPKINLDLIQDKNDILIEDFFEVNMFQPIISQSSFAAKKTVFTDVKYNENLNRAVDIDWYIRVFLKYKLAYYNTAHAIIKMNIPGQMTGSEMAGKIIPDFDLYETETANNKSLKKYLDFYRYTFLIQYKLNGDFKRSSMLFEKIDPENLTLKQKMLAKSPLFILKLIKGIKKFLVKFNIRLTSF